MDGGKRGEYWQMSWEIGKGKIKVKGFTNTKGCDYKIQGEKRGREIEDIVRIAPSCDHQSV